MPSIKDVALGALLVTTMVFGTQLFEKGGPYFVASRAVASASMAGDISSTSTDTNAGQVSENTPTNDQSNIQTRYEYKLVFDVDACTLTTLGKDSWEPIEFGKDTNTGDDLHLGAGKDSNCQQFRNYQVFVWILFKRATTTASS